jgi:predicted component of type VI protein secretion system
MSRTFSIPGAFLMTFALLTCGCSSNQKKTETPSPPALAAIPSEEVSSKDLPAAKTKQTQANPADLGASSSGRGR